MIGKSPNQGQKHLFLPNLTDFINPRHELCLLANRIDWKQFETEFAPLYSTLGQPAKPIRLMVGLLILKQIYDLGDETVMSEWVSNPYFQYFCGESVFQWQFPCDPSDLVHFRHRIGHEGVEKILAVSILLHGKEVLEEDVSIDTTVQEKNITYPTDTKLAVKIIKQCRAIAEKQAVQLRQSYRFVVKDLLKKANARSAKKAAEKRKARRKLKTIAKRLVRELKRKLSAASLAENQDMIELFEQVLKQKKEDKNKIYSLHAPETACIAKGKEHKKYEFGSKVAFVVSQKSNVVMAAVSFRGNPNDNQTLEKPLNQQERLTGVRAKRAYVDRGCKSQAIGETQIISPSSGAGKTTAEKSRLRKSFRRRAAIEPDISHLKSDFGLGRNYLKGEIGDEINAMLAASAFNFKSWMRKALKQLIFVLNLITKMWHQLWSQSESMPISRILKERLIKKKKAKNSSPFSFCSDLFQSAGFFD
jgi:transposase, IS5 family